MRKIFIALTLAALIVPSQAFAEDTPARTETHYSVETTLVGKLLDDPAAAEVLKRLIPAVYTNEMFQSMGRDTTLKNIQQYEPAALSDENLAKIQAEFYKLPAKN